MIRTSSLVALSLLPCFSLVACSAESSGSATQLEAFEASSDQQADPYEGSEVSGDAVVTGGDRDWTLAVSSPGGDAANVTVHAPGASDLSSLDGDPLTIVLGDAWGSDTRTVDISDDAGPVFYGQPRMDYGPATDAFGTEFAAFGDEIATGTMTDDYGDYSVSYRKAVFQTDDGAVEALAGEPFEAQVGGATWRIVVHASFQVTEYPDAMPGCGGGTGTTLSFEMLRVEDTPSLEKLTPLSGGLLAGQSHCG